MMDIEKIAEADRAQLMDVVRAELYLLDRGELDRVARSIGRSCDCLARIRRGSTKWPTAATLFPLARKLGLCLIFVPEAEAKARGYQVVKTVDTVLAAFEHRTAH